MKCTYVGPLPKPVTYERYVTFTVTSKPPVEGLAKDLPPLPRGHQEAWTLYVTTRQWNRVAQAFRTNQQEKAVAEGIAVCRPSGLELYVTALKAVSIEKERQAMQKAAAVVSG